MIVHKELQLVAIKDLKKAQVNPRVHQQEQIDLIKKSIEQFGFTSPILVDEDRNVIAGHGRLRALSQLKEEAAPCIIVEGLNEEQKRALLIADNKIAEVYNGWDEELLKAELKALDNYNYSLEDLGFSNLELNRLFKESNKALNDIENALPEAPTMMSFDGLTDVAQPSINAGVAMSNSAIELSVEDVIALLEEATLEDNSAVKILQNNNCIVITGLNL